MWWGEKAKLVCAVLSHNANYYYHLILFNSEMVITTNVHAHYTLGTELLLYTDNLI